MLLAERMGWTLDYVDGLDARDVLDTFTVLDAKDKAIVSIRESTRTR